MALVRAVVSAVITPVVFAIPDERTSDICARSSSLRPDSSSIAISPPSFSG